MLSKPMKPVVVHDYFAIRGGGERLVLTLANALEAGLIFGYRDAESYEDVMFPRNVRNLGLPVPFRRPGLRAAALSLRFRAERRQMIQYHTRIFSGVAAPLAAPDRYSGRNIYYCHTPPRFLYDQKEHFADRLTGIGAAWKAAALERYRRGYEASVERMDVVIANSRTVQERIRTYLGRESIVIYPPCDTERFAWHGQEDYYLSTARLSGLKRIDKIIDAFLLIPDRRLVVVSGGDQMEVLRARAANAPNITFLGWVDEARLRRLIGDSIATIYVPLAEDFGMSPVESMAAGKPVIGVSDGGLRETIVHEETGTLLPTDFTADDLARAVLELSPARAKAMREACEARADTFSQTRFIDSMRAIVAT